jgi:Receptor family ligand binding region
LKLSEYIISKSSLIIDLYSTYSQAVSQNDSDRFVGRILKANGLRKVIIIDNFFVSISESIYSANIDGDLIVVEAGLEDAVSSDNYHYTAIFKALSNLNSSLSNISNIEKSTVYKTAKILYPSHTTCTSYSLVNVHNQKKKIVGEIEEDKLRITSSIYYPGNTTNLLLGRSKIVISIANTSTEIFNLYNYTYFSQVNDGAVYAMDESNRKNDIEGYYVSLFPTGCGIFLYDPGWFSNCYSKVINDMGVAYIDSFWYTATYGDLITLRSLGNIIPQLSYIGGSPALDNYQEFPEFLRITMSLQGFTSSISIFLNAMKWRYACYITDLGENFLDIFINILKSFNVYLLNPIESMVFPPNYSRGDFEQYKSSFQTIKDSKCVIIAAFVGNILPYLEGLYDIGLRRGDVYVISYLNSIEQLNTKDEEVYENKWYEIGESSLKITPKLWIGDFGNNVKTQMTKVFPQTTQDYCLAYDTFSVIKSGIQYTLSLGDNIEDPIILMKNIRAVKITGCSGNIMFDSTTNSALNAAALLSQAWKNQSTGQYYPLPIVSIDRISNQLLTYKNNFTWGILIPLDLRPNNSCPFDTYLVEDFPRGMEILCAFCVFFSIISLIARYYSFKFFNTHYAIDKEKKVVSISDITFISYFLLQYFQLVTLGPKYNSIEPTLYILEVRLSMNLMNYYNFAYSKFWVHYKILLVLCSIWMLGCLGVFLVFKRMRNNVFTNHILPMIGKMLFIPLFSMLLNIYICKESISDSLTDSFFNFDCTTFCYNDGHLVHLILGSLVTTGF